MRVFVVDGREFPDPNPAWTIEEVRQHMAGYFPELSNAETKESKRPNKDNPAVMDDIIEFKKRVGTKGKKIAQTSGR
jgi:PRTRC genetic system protein C